MQTERHLVELAQQKDEQAFARLYEEYFDKIYRYIALKIGNKMEAEDLTQQVFMNALRSMSSFKWQDNTPFSAWLYRIAHNQIVDYLRKKSRQPTVDIEIVAPLACADDPVETTEVNIDYEKFVKVSAKLTPAQQEVISLRFSSDLPIAEVAKIMNRTPGAVKALQHSAVSSLRRMLSGA
ncbi:MULTISPECIES: ECF subfamily RNA polymerase sigma factor, BldN family [Dehalococcoides]|uniref:RNA polymerase sigma-70 factor, ECF subfamily n=2 Tax=Dehalococcoides mccartyi TaxID=61435 RepID=A0A916P5F3_DEHMC|nr:MULTISPECIES: ECF subfamily RNA polymerase sigma factor, BldN family [Dehalococcoides]AGG06806.1 RNA polymerase sigma-70 factor, ECF subfamily [Dehalococcoides mccartyi DCMB5]AGG08301.1 RNA polymerase sigma-70 factor, ECF subfamily [Dehalococcoides mccartyi BTF08]AQX73601.1 RNA polymerase subunit sigma-70 [Dehalococcoides mccartyi]AQX75018.1 RNA polymerase subunit sigma-70 [Dehalococcoides mccartyi]AQY73593.1 RNA polymerase subunit sigma-70 [Dehalococcoides mccartyi]